MVLVPFVLAASGLFTLSLAAPIPLARPGSISTRVDGTYVNFGGDGTTGQGWPTQENWVSTYDEMFDKNIWMMKISCSQWGVPDNSDAEVAVLKTSIPKISAETGIDSRFILAVILQESKGCVRAPTTANGVSNPGLMQSHNGKGSCNGGGQVLNPCPEEQILQMIRDGTEGTGQGDGLQALVEKTNANSVSSYYKASRIYNSGSIAASGNLGDGNGSTACYASDIANRLVGWSADPSPCKPAEIINVIGVGGPETPAPETPAPETPAPETPAPEYPGETPAPETPAPETPAPETPAPEYPGETPAPETPAPEYPGETPAPETPAPETPAPEYPGETPAPEIPAPEYPGQTPAPETPAPETPAPEYPGATPETPVVVEQAPVEENNNIYPGATQGCSEYHLVEENDFCDVVNKKFGITLDDLIKLNTGLQDDCKNLWLGYSYCVRA